jgi:hypothetical protein
MSEVRLNFYGGKYTYIRNDIIGGQGVLRYGEEWRDLTGDKFILAMAQEIEDLRKFISDLAEVKIEGKDNATLFSDFDQFIREARVFRKEFGRIE